MGAGQSKANQLAPLGEAAVEAREVPQASNAREAERRGKRERDDPLGKEGLTEEGTNQDGGSDAMSERRESERFGKGLRYAKKGDRDGR